MIDRPTFDTRALLRRSRLAFTGALLLAWLEGATHQLVLSSTRVVFYRRVAGGAVEAATASADESGWSLSGWLPRVVPRLPPGVRELTRPDITARALTMPLT